MYPASHRPLEDHYDHRYPNGGTFTTVSASDYLAYVQEGLQGRHHPRNAINGPMINDDLAAWNGRLASTILRSLLEPTPPGLLAWRTEKATWEWVLTEILPIYDINPQQLIQTIRGVPQAPSEGRIYYKGRPNCCARQGEIVSIPEKRSYYSKCIRGRNRKRRCWPM